MHVSTFLPQRCPFWSSLCVPLALSVVQDCELLYIAFDILHNGKIGVNEEPLKERHKLLEEVVVPAEIAGMWGCCRGNILADGSNDSCSYCI